MRFDRYGGVDVLEVRDVEDPAPQPDRVVVRVRAAGVNPGGIGIRGGRLAAVWPTTFPSGEGSDFAGTVNGVGDEVDGFSPGDPVLGWTDERASHAELLSVPADHVVPRPDALAWEVAGAMFVAPMAGYACVVTVDPRPGEAVVVSGASSASRRSA